MSTTFSKLKFADDRSKVIIFGFIRKIKINQDEIPAEIKQLCLLFYFQAEQFGQHGKKLKVSCSDDANINDIIEQHIEGFWYSGYGTFIINPIKYPSAIYIWTLKFSTQSSAITTPSIGIVSVDTEYPLETYCFMSQEYDFYAWETTWKCARDKLQASRGYAEELDNGLECGDIIVMELNIPNATLKYTRNGKDLGIAHDNINMQNKYCLGLSFAAASCKFQLIEFECK